MNNTEKSQKFRAAMRAQSLFEVRGIYAPKPSHAQIKAYAAKLAKKDINLEPIAWVGRHINDVENDRLLIFQFKNEAEKWRDQYKVGYAWLEELIIKSNVKVTGATPEKG